MLSGILESEHDEMVRLYTSLPRKLVLTGSRRRGDGTDPRGGHPRPPGDGWVALSFTAPP